MSRPKHVDRALAQVRRAVHGWAFSPKSWLPGMISAAEIQVAELPSEYRAEGEALVQPLREELAK